MSIRVRVAPALQIQAATDINRFDFSLVDLEELNNVNSDEGLVSGSILVYDAATAEWTVTATLDGGTY
jgi:hypothetical protein